jgi:hypothetical protein
MPILIYAGGAVRVGEDVKLYELTGHSTPYELKKRIYLLMM